MTGRWEPILDGRFDSGGSVWVTKPSWANRPTTDTCPTCNVKTAIDTEGRFYPHGPKRARCAGSLTLSEAWVASAGPSDIEDQIAWLENDITERKHRLEQLHLLVSHPVVMPVISYWDRGTLVSNPLFVGAAPWQYGLLQMAYSTLRDVLDNGLGDPAWVRVGGFVITWDELIKEFEESNDG